MTSLSGRYIKQFIMACRRAAGRGLMRCSSGNMSWRVNPAMLLATATRSWMSRMTPDDVAICRLRDGKVLNHKKPTIEINFHAGILRSRPDINVVMHFQTPCATALGCLKRGKINYFVTPEIPYYIGPVARVPYYLPGSRKLADAVTGAMLKHDLVIMGNHGLVTVAKDFDHVIQNAEFFELACGIILRAGKDLQPLSGKSVNELRALRKKGSGGGG